LLLAPGAAWLQAQVTRIDAAMNAAPQPAVEPAEETVGLHTSSRNRHREAFIGERLAEAGAALDDGDLDKASSIVAGVLRKYPDDSRALVLMDRIVLITDRGVDVKPYRQAIRAAREALANGDLAAARRSCAVAVAIWPDDDEVLSLDREIEEMRKVEVAAALAVCDDVLGRAAGGALPDGGLPPELARARDALRRAEEMGAAASLVEEKTGALLRIEREANQRADERQKQQQEAERARLAEIARLMGEARAALDAASGATGAAAMQAALTGVRAVLESSAKAEGLGADRGETQDLAARLESAAKELTKRIALDAEQEREARARADAIRAGIAELDGLDLSRAEARVRELRAELGTAATARPSAPGLSELRAKLDGVESQIAKRLQDEKARQEKEARDRAAQEERDRLAREKALEKEARERAAQEEKDRLAREKVLEEQRRAAERAAAKAERLRSLLDEARAGYREADDLAASIDTEADRMGAPLAAARRAVDEMLKIEAGDEEAKALRKRIERLEKLASEHAASAAQLRETAKQRERELVLQQQQEKRAALRRVLVRGAIAVVVAAVLAGGWFGYSKWSESRERAAQADRDRLEAERKERQTRDRAEASKALSDAGEELARLRSGIAGITTEPQRGQALSDCDTVIEKINGAGKLDLANGDAARLLATASNLKTEIRGLPIPEVPPPPPPADQTALNATLKSIRDDLRFAGEVPHGPLAEVDRGLQRADHGIGLAKSVLAGDPGHAETQAPLGQLQSTRKTLVRWQQELRADDTRKGERQKADLASAAALLDKAEAALKSKREPAAALADTDQVARTLDAILRDDLHQRDALALRTRNDRVREELNKLKNAKPEEVAKPIEKVKETPKEQPATALDMNAVQSLFTAYKSALIARDSDEIRKVYPGYPSMAQLGKLQQFEYDFSIVNVDAAKNLVVIRQTTRMRQALGYWDPPNTATLQYTLARNPAGSWYIQSGRIAPK
jgi:hypothetical protein